jgi:hypothetical protein
MLERVEPVKYISERSAAWEIRRWRVRSCMALVHRTLSGGTPDSPVRQTRAPFGSIVWGTDIPWVHWKDKRPHERPKGPINRKVILSWAWRTTTSEVDRRKAGSVWAQTARWLRASNHNSDPTFPRWNPVQRNQARMGRRNYRRIDSIGSLSFRRMLISYPHVMPHGRIYKA